VSREHRQPCGHDRVHITPRQREALRFFVSGLDQKQIARRMGIAAVTVQKHLRAMRAKTGTHNAQGLAVWACDRSRCCLDLGALEAALA
jgi:DNA-binding CsgD family transcriptional regulator